MKFNYGYSPRRETRHGCPCLTEQLKNISAKSARDVFMSWSSSVSVWLRDSWSSGPLLPQGTKVCRKLYINDAKNSFFNCNQHFCNFKP